MVIGIEAVGSDIGFTAYAEALVTQHHLVGAAAGRHGNELNCIFGGNGNGIGILGNFDVFTRINGDGFAVLNLFIGISCGVVHQLATG